MHRAGRMQRQMRCSQTCWKASALIRSEMLAQTRMSATQLMSSKLRSVSTLAALVLESQTQMPDGTKPMNSINKVDKVQTEAS